MKYAAILTTLALGMTASAAIAQDYTLPPNYGDVELRAGFSPDPFTVDLQSGGAINANSSIGGSCRGYIDQAPDFSVHYSAGSVLPLRIGVASGTDTTLVVNGPDGSWYCDDDGGGDLNPLLQFNNPQSGRYDIWVGTYGSASLADATLFITELTSVTASTIWSGGASGSSGGMPDWSLPATYETVNLRGGFTPDPYRVRLQSGGNIDAAQALGGSCVGFIARAPDVRLNFQAGSLPLIISVVSSSDTTLVINGPDGGWYCDDDGGQGLNPSIRWDSAMSGQYDIWVGTWASATLRDATLVISELYSE